MDKIEHGGNVKKLASELGYSPSECLDFSANINPLGLSDKLKACLMENVDSLLHYPDIEYSQAKQILANFHQQEPSAFSLGNGAVELFYDLARFYRPKRVLTLAPTFMEYEKAFVQVGSQILYETLTEPDYQLDVDKLWKKVAHLDRGDVIIICNPNNPTGTVISNSTLMVLAEKLQSRGILLVIDEAFADFLQNEADYTFIPYLKRFTNVIVVRSLTKFHAIPGLRLGYAITYLPDCIKNLENSRAPWTINSFAEQALTVILEDDDYRERTHQWLQREQNFLFHSLQDIPDIIPLKPTVNYIFFTYKGDVDLRKKLWEEKIFIRSCANYHGLTSQHYRIAIRSRKENVQLLKALNKICRGENQDENN